MHHNVPHLSGRFNAVYTLLCVWCGLKALNFSLARTLFLFFFSVSNQLVRNKMKNNLKIYLQKFADIEYLRIFVENIKTKNNDNYRKST